MGKAADSCPAIVGSFIEGQALWICGSRVQRVKSTRPQALALVILKGLVGLYLNGFLALPSSYALLTGYVSLGRLTVHTNSCIAKLCGFPCSQKPRCKYPEVKWRLSQNPQRMRSTTSGRRDVAFQADNCDSQLCCQFRMS